MYVPFGLKFSWGTPLFSLIFLAVSAVGIMLTFFPQKCLKKRPYAGKNRYTFARIAGIVIVSFCIASFLLTNVFGA